MNKSKKGAVLTLALLVMFVGAIILAGLFQYLGSSLLLATKGEENAVNYYAADSGIEDALYGLINDQAYEQNEYTLNYTNYADNNRTVNISVVKDPYNWGSRIGNTTYKITSTATHNKSGVSTTIESFVRAAPLEFYRFGDDAITSNCSVDLQPTGGHGNPVQGNVTYVCDVDCSDDPNATNECPEDGEQCCEQSVNGSMNYAPGGIEWRPETWAIDQYFRDQVDLSQPFTAGVIDVAVTSTIGPLYVEGDLDIKSSQAGSCCNKHVQCPRLTLNGPLYITGHLTMGGAKCFILDLNGQVIFVKSADESPHEAIVIDEQCIVEGSGAIFAIGSIHFQPSIDTAEDGFIFIMSIEGGTHLQPNGDFYGSIAGHDYVDVQPNTNIIHNDSDMLWSQFPDDDVVVTKVLTYNIVDR